MSNPEEMEKNSNDVTTNGAEESMESTEVVSDDSRDNKISAEEKDSASGNDFIFNVGDTVVVSNRIQEDNRTRIQNFEGVVIAKKGSGVSKTFTVRKIGSNNIGVERIFPQFSPNVTDIKVTRQGKVRRAKLYYLRDRKGKAATYVKPAK